MQLKKTAFIPFILVITFCLSFTDSKAQLPNPSLVGYWQNWNDVNSPYIDLTSIDSRYNVIEVSFAVPQAGTSYQMVFDPQDGGVSQAAFISKIQTVKAQGRKVLISIGGGGVHVSLDNASEKAGFISSMNSIIDTYGFDGIDIDFEGTSLTVTPGSTIASPVDVPVINLIDAIKQIMQHHRTVAGTKLLLTMAPETVFVQGAMSSYGGDGGIRGAYLPVIHALRDSIDLLQVQLYNSGDVYGIDGGIYDQATPDFITAMGEAVIAGFTTQGGTFTGLPASKVAIGLPACGAAAPGGGYIAPATVRAAMKYLMGAGPKPGGALYTLQQAGGYPSLRGMMTWSVNWDVLSTCAGANEYAINFQTIFSPATGTGTTDNALVGYWQNWIDPNAPYIPLTSVDSRYNIIEVSFAVPQSGTSYQMVFDPQDGGVSQATFISQIQTLQSQGRKVLISMGGGGVHVSLDNTTEKNSFISSMNSIIDTYGFDGIDIDFEGTSLTVTPGSTITSPVDVPVINLIDAIKQIMQHHRTVAGTKLLLTMAPETVFVQGAMSSYGGDGGVRGAYLPVIHALRDSIDILQVQLYNTGDVYGIDGNIYDQSTTDFIVAMGEAVIAGFNTGGGMFTGLPASKIAIGLPACPAAAPGGGYLDTLNVKKAMLYLMGSGPKPGSYTLQQAGGYPSLKGMMTWSVNWDVLATCASANEFAVNFQRIFNSPNVWTGAISSAWENPGNWSKNVVPDSNTNVIINSGNVILNSNGFCRTITIASTAHLTVNMNFKLTVTH